MLTECHIWVLHARKQDVVVKRKSCSSELFLHQCYDGSVPRAPIPLSVWCIQERMEQYGEDPTLDPSTLVYLAHYKEGVCRRMHQCHTKIEECVGCQMVEHSTSTQEVNTLQVSTELKIVHVNKIQHGRSQQVLRLNTTMRCYSWTRMFQIVCSP